MHLRTEVIDDEDAIDRVVSSAFAALSHCNNTEAQIVRELRIAGDLTLSLVAELGGAVAGHVAFSPVAIDGAHEAWFGLGPLAVLPSLQRRGIGSALVERGLAMLRERGAKGCAVLGDPNYYGRFGFVSDGGLRYGTVPRRFIQGIAFEGGRPSGELTYAPAFDLAGP